MPEQELLVVRTGLPLGSCPLCIHCRQPAGVGCDFTLAVSQVVRSAVRSLHAAVGGSSGLHDRGVRVAVCVLRGRYAAADSVDAL